MKKKITLALLAVVAIYLFFFPPSFISEYLSPNLQVEYPDIVHFSKNIESSASITEAVNLQNLILQRDYAGLNAWMDACQKAAEVDVAKDGSKTLTAARFFNANVIEYAGFFDEWTAAYPNAYQPYLARAFYEFGLGWESRGTKWSSETTDEQIEGMILHFKNAVYNAQAALKINSKLMPAYWVMIRVAQTSGELDIDAKEVLATALVQVGPLTFGPRMAYMRGLTTRWGGSYEEQDAFANEAQVYADKNPALKRLLGLKYCDRADDLDNTRWQLQERVNNSIGRMPIIGQRLASYLNEKISAHYGEKRLRLYAKALTYDDYDFFRSERAEFYYQRDQYDKAKEDITRAIELAPENPMHRMLLIRINCALGEYGDAMNNIVAANKLGPWNRELKSEMEPYAKWLVATGAEYYAKKDFQGAVIMLELGLAADAKNKLALYWLGRVAYAEGDLPLALANFQRASELDPGEFAYYESIDMVYAKMGYAKVGISIGSTVWANWACAQADLGNDSIESWDRYIKLKPQDGRPWLMKARAHYCRGDLDAALADAKKAVELGNKDASGRYEMISQRLAAR